MREGGWPVLLCPSLHPILLDTAPEHDQGTMMAQATQPSTMAWPGAPCVPPVMPCLSCLLLQELMRVAGPMRFLTRVDPAQALGSSSCGVTRLSPSRS